MEPLEYSKANDLFFDFCLWEYKPTVPWENKLRSSNLLFHSFDVMGLDERARDLVRSIREWAGLSRTVWGMKHQGNRIFWEFYFYDYRRRQRQRSITGFLDRFRDLIPCEVRANENLNYFMFSVDIDQDLISRGKKLDEIHMYVGNPGSTVSSGICYSLTNGGTRLENDYFFFDARRQMPEIRDKAACSAFFDEKAVRIDQILWPELLDCTVIVVANKQYNDGVYFSRVNVDQLIFFLRRTGWHGEMVSFVEKHRSGLDHLFFDVAFDYRMEKGHLTIQKSACFGIF
jgi:hypothetical protein